MAATALLLQWLVLGPIGKFTGHVLAIGRNGDISRRVGLDRADELGLLGREFDAMLENLAQARNRLLDQSYRSGIAEMASGVLHNLRNQLAPLAMRLGRLREQTAVEDDDKIDRALDELMVASVPADRKAKIVKYIRMSMRVEKDGRCKTAEQLSGLVDDFVRLKNVLQDMDRFSRAGSDEVESTLLYDVVQETIGMLPTFPDVRMGIKVDATLQALPPVLGKSFALRHILHNVMINALEAIAASNRPRGELRISASVTTIDGRDFVELRLDDDGIGIAAETLPEIFGRGFSTKKGERGGSGLHWSANCIAAMGGKIVAESEGIGHGTTFRLTLPVAVPVTEAAA
jgi:signal transduction histidine kinase